MVFRVRQTGFNQFDIENTQGLMIARAYDEDFARQAAASLSLLTALKAEHGWDDPLHTKAMPNCWKCKAIADAEGR